ncbi:hypothetical protein AB0B89_36605, partial [Sphaerisporangium sp. NPDC049002]
RERPVRDRGHDTGRLDAVRPRRRRRTAGHALGSKRNGIDFAGDEEPKRWKELQAFYLGQPIRRAMNEAAQSHGWKALYNDAKTYQAWASEVGTLAGKYIQEITGDSFFCAPTYAGTGECGSMVLIVQKPVPPAGLEDAMAAEQAAKAQNAAQTQINTRVQTELKSLRDLAKVLGKNGAILYKAIQDGRISIVPVPTGGAINVTPR